MRIKFRPMPGLTIAALIALGILLFLGTWQYNRLNWKTNLLVEIDEAANAAPLTSLQNLDDLLEAKKPIDFRRIELSGDFTPNSLNNGQAFHLMKSTGKYFEWRSVQPFVQEGAAAYIATRHFPDSLKHSPPPDINGSANIVGYVRLVRPVSKFTPASNQDTNRWFAFNSLPETLDWGVADGRTLQTAYYIDMAEDKTSAVELPVRKPDIRNSHLDYMLTWYSFALILLIIYLLVHKRAGRLSIERN